VLKNLFSMGFKAFLDTSHRGPPHPFKCAGVVADRLKGIHIAMVKCPFTGNMSCIQKDFYVSHTGKNPDSNLASVEAMQWVIAQHG
jgi:hypothetical protein